MLTSAQSGTESETATVDDLAAARRPSVGPADATSQASSQLWPGPVPTAAPVPAVDSTASSISLRHGHRTETKGTRSLGSASQRLPGSSGFAASSRRYLGALVTLDALVGLIAGGMPAAMSGTLSQETWTVAVLALVGAAMWPVSIGLARGYVGSQIGIGSDEMRAAFRASIGVVVVGAFAAGILQLQPLLTLVLLGTPAAAGMSTLVRFGARKELHRIQRRGRGLRRVVVVGGPKSAYDLAGRLQREPHCGMQVVGVCQPTGDRSGVSDHAVPMLGDLQHVPAVVKEFGCDAVAVTCDDFTRHAYLRELGWALEGSGVDLLVDPGLVEIAGPRMHIRPLVGFPLLQIQEPDFAGWRRVVKRATDVAITLVGLMFAGPVMALIAAGVKLSDGGPVIFKQTRVGRHGRPFTMLKFRSMVVDAEARKAELMDRNEGKGGLFKLAVDPRVTRIGQVLRSFSLDELPQLFNVLAGSMSLVGPRPHLASELAQMPDEASRRSLVTPGLTGLWQVSGRSDLPGDESVRLDLRYVENWSLTLDLLILWKTGKAVLTKAGAR